MNDFGLYFTFGLEHIFTWEALDHILFVTALCLRYHFKDYKQIFILITAFTIGHCTTLVLSTLDIVSVKSSLTEFFIALTILCTAISNVFVKDGSRRHKFSFIYIIALLFGMIHGLGFAYGLKSILGKNESIFVPLLAFNCGIETAQIVVALVVLIVSYIFVAILKVPFRYWLLFISGVIFGLSLQMAIDRNPFKENKNDETSSGVFINDGRRFSHRSVAILQ
jgi:hypothetical protein